VPPHPTPRRDSWPALKTLCSPCNAYGAAGIRGVTIESTEGLVSQLRWTRAVVIALVVAGSATYFTVQTT